MDIIQSTSSFKYASIIDLNMGFYTMALGENSKIYFVIILPLDIYRYNILPMGILLPCNIFQAAMWTLFQDLKHIIVYLDDIITLGSGTLEEYLAVINQLPFRLFAKGIQVIFSKSTCTVQEVKYLGFVITRDDIKPQPKKVQAIVNFKPPATQKKLRRFLGVILFIKTYD